MAEYLTCLARGCIDIKNMQRKWLLMHLRDLGQHFSSPLISGMPLPFL